MELWTLYRNFKARYTVHAYCDFKLEFQYNSAVKMCSVLKFPHSMEYFCFM